MAMHWARPARGRRRATAFYRHPAVRWSFVGSGGFLAWALAFGPYPWRSTPSLLWLHQIVPWPVLAAGAGVYTALQAWGRLEAVIFADFMGLALYLVAFIALAATLDPGNINNPFALAAVFLACVMHFAAGRLAVNDRERPCGEP